MESADDALSLFLLGARSRAAPANWADPRGC
jgi:hypothetical protein